MNFEEWIKKREPQYHEDLTMGEKALYEEIYDLEQAVLENSITSVFNDFIPFLEAMEAEYLRHYPEKGDSWMTCELGYLKSTLREVFWKYFRNHNNANELVDLAILSAMI